MEESFKVFDTKEAWEKLYGVILEKNDPFDTFYEWNKEKIDENLPFTARFK